METPNCDELASSSSGLNNTLVNSDYIFWRYSNKTKELEKLVLSADFTFAYEKLEKVCGSNPK